MAGLLVVAEQVLVVVMAGLLVVVTTDGCDGRATGGGNG